MPAQVRALLDRILEWWNKFSTRQKTMIITGAAAVVLAVVILVMVFTRPTYVHLYTATTRAESSQVDSILSEAGLDYKASTDGMSFTINASQESQANILLNGNSIRSEAWSISDVTSGGFSTTESDKNRQWVDYLEKKIAGDFIKTFDAVTDARVELHVPDQDGTLLSRNLESGAAIVLTLKNDDDFTEDNAAYLARAVATAIGNPTTDNIVIMDTKARLLFAGGSDGSTAGGMTTQLSYKSKMEQSLRSQVRNVVIATGLFSKVEVGLSLDIDFSDAKVVEHLYFAPEGQTQGVLAHQDNYEATNTSGVAGIPGTDSNDETTYVLQDNQNARSSVEENSYDYLPNERITESTRWGQIDMGNSTISVTATNYRVINQSDYRASDNGGLSWTEYKAANALPILQNNDELFTQMRQLVANATGIAPENVALVLYDQNYFVDSSGMSVGVTDILQIVLIIVILLLLAFVIMRSMRTARETDEEGVQELSVESLLESQPLDSDLENIEMDEGSETKRLIEKFIDENPEAAASLLRNWLNEGFM